MPRTIARVVPVLGLIGELAQEKTGRHFRAVARDGPFPSDPPPLFDFGDDGVEDFGFSALQQPSEGSEGQPIANGHQSGEADGQ